MLCQNCQSDDIVRIQEQYYCLSCGQLVKAKDNLPAKSPAEKIAANAVPATAESTLKIKPRSSAALPQTDKTVTKATSSKKLGLVIPAKILSSPPATLTQASAVSLGMTDLRPGVRQASATPVRTAPAPTASTPLSPVSAKASSVQNTPRQSSESLLGFAAAEVVTPANYRFAGPLGAIAAITIWLATMLGTYGRINPITTQSDFVLGLGCLAAAGLIAAYLYRVFATAAIIYGASKQLDGRPASPKQWSQTARGSLSDMCRLDLAALLSYLPLLVAEAALITYVAQAAITPVYLKYLVLLSAHVIIIYLAVGVALARRLGIYSLALAGVKPLAAFRLGWGLYRHHFGRVTAAAIVVTICSIALWAVMAAAGLGIAELSTQSTSGYAAIIKLVGQLALLALAVSVTLVFNAAFWLKFYRRLIPHAYPDQPHKLITRQAPLLTKSRKPGMF